MNPCSEVAQLVLLMARHLPPLQERGLWGHTASAGQRSTTCLHGERSHCLACNTARLLRLIDRLPLSRLHEMRFAAAYEENFPLTLAGPRQMSPNHLLHPRNRPRSQLLCSCRTRRTCQRRSFCFLVN